MSKYLSKEELQTDPLLQNVAKATTFFNENRTVIIAVFTGIFVIIGSFIGYHYHSIAQEKQAQELLSIIEKYYSEGDYEIALNGNSDGADLTFGFLAIANEFSGTEAGNLANYYASVSSFKLANIEDALIQFEKFEAPSGILGVSPISFYASILKENNNLEKAALTYIKAAEWDVNESTSPYNLLESAKILHKLGKFEEAKQLTERIKRKYPNSTEATEAVRLEGRISISVL